MALTMKSSLTLPVAKRNVRCSAPAVLRNPARKVVIRASAEPTPSPVTSEAVQKAQAAVVEAWAWAKAKWEATEDSEKPAVIAILAGVIIAQIAIGATIDVVDRIPIVSTVLQLVGLAVTGVYIVKLTTDPEEREGVKSSVSGFLDKVTGSDK